MPTKAEIAERFRAKLATNPAPGLQRALLAHNRNWRDPADQAIAVDAAFDYIGTQPQDIVQVDWQQAIADLAGALPTMPENGQNSAQQFGQRLNVLMGHPHSPDWLVSSCESLKRRLLYDQDPGDPIEVELAAALDSVDDPSAGVPEWEAAAEVFARWRELSPEAPTP